METEFDTAAIRQLLNGAFSDEQLMTFFYDHFRDAYDLLVPGMGKLVKVQHLIEHCDRHGRLAELLRLVEQYNPHQFGRYRHRLQAQPAAPDRSTAGRSRRGLVTLLTSMAPRSGRLSANQQAMLQMGFEIILATVLEAPLGRVEVVAVLEEGAALQALLPLEAIARLMTMDGRYLADELGIREVQITTAHQGEGEPGRARTGLVRADAALGRALDRVRALLAAGDDRPAENRESAPERSWQLPRLNTKFGTLLEGYRRARGLAQTDLAELLGVKWSATTIGRYERGQQTPPPAFVLEVVQALALNEDEEAALLNALQTDIMHNYLAEYNAAKARD